MRLPWVETKAYTGYRKYIGRSAAGFAHPFYLGRDQSEAEKKIERLGIAWKAIRAAGGTAWTDEAIEAALLEKPSASSVQQSGDNLTLHVALDLYAEYVKYKQASSHWKAGVLTRGARLKRLLPDRNMTAVDADAILKMVATITARPTSKATGRALAVDTVCDTIKGLKAALDWLDMTERWAAPRRFDRLFRVRRRALLKPSERQVRAIHPTFRLDELKSLYARVPDRVRLFIVLGINCGLTQNEISELQKAEFDLNKGLLERQRPKTGVVSRHALWPETVELVRTNLAPSGSDFAFLTHHGLALVRIRGAIRCDGIYRWWQRVKAPKSFKLLRKTGASWLRQQYGDEIATMYLAHAEGSVMGKHYANRPIHELDEPLRQMRNWLSPMFMVP